METADFSPMVTAFDRTEGVGAGNTELYIPPGLTVTFEDLDGLPAIPTTAEVPEILFLGSEATILSTTLYPAITTHPTPSSSVTSISVPTQPPVTSSSAPTQPSVITATVTVSTTISPTSTDRSGLTSGQKAAIAVPILLVALGLSLIGFFLFFRRRKPQRGNTEIENHPQPKLEEQTVPEDMPKKQ